MKANYTTHYFSTEMKLMMIIVLIVIDFFVYISGNEVLAIITILLGIGILLTYKYRISVDLEAKNITDKTTILGIDIKNKKYQYDELLEIRLDKELERHTANTRSRTRQVEFNIYTATIITDKEEIEILSSSDYRSFSEKLKDFANEIGTQIQRSF